MAEAGLGKVSLSWFTDEEDFEDLLGYNIYRWTDFRDSTYVYYDENGEYNPHWKYFGDTAVVNDKLLLPEDIAYIDFDVVPGTSYYYEIRQITTGFTEYNFSNPVKASVYRDLEVVFAYTNITFTDKQKEDLPKLYDMLKSSGVLGEIIATIPEAEYNDICAGVWQSVESIYKYQNSVLGLLDTIKTDYNNMKLDIDSLNQAITDPETLEFVKALLTNVN
jgi:hypothetical protein